jgi:hypothetical protein
MEALDWRLLVVAKSEFGANRKYRGNRFLTVIQFCLDMVEALKELVRVCTPGARLKFVVGRQSKVRGTTFFNGEIVTELAGRALGLSLSLRQERVFLNRYGQRIYEDILHFSRPRQPVKRLPLEEARSVAQQALQAAYQTAPEMSRVDLQAALANNEKVLPSPLFQRLQAHNGAAPIAHGAGPFGSQNV